MAEEKIFIVNLRKEIMKAPMHRRAKKAVNAMKEYIAKHMKTKDVRMGMSLNLKMWSRGIQNPPTKLKISVTKDDKGVATAELFGAKVEKKVEAKEEKKTKAKKAEKVDEASKEE